MISAFSLLLFCLCLPCHRRCQYSVFRLCLLAAGRAFFVFEKLEHAAVPARTPVHQRRSAVFTILLYKSPVPAKGTNYVKRTPAARAKRLPFLYFAQTCRTQIIERTVRSAGWTKPRVTVCQSPAMNTRLFICRHNKYPSLFIRRSSRRSRRDSPARQINLPYQPSCGRNKSNRYPCIKGILS